MKAALFLFLILSPSAQAKGLEEYLIDVNFSKFVETPGRYEQFLAASDPITPSAPTTTTAAVSKPSQTLAQSVFRKGSFFPRTNKEKCSTVDGLKEKLGEVRNQDGLGWCFATMVADLLSAETGQRLSDFDMGLNYFTGYGPKQSVADLSAGSPLRLVRQVLRQGACPEKDMPATERMVAEGAAILARAGEHEVAKKFGLTHHIILEEGIRALEKVRGLSVDKLLQREAATCSALEVARAMFPALNQKQILDALTTSTSNEKLMKALVGYTCSRAPLVLSPGFRFRQLVVDTEAKDPWGFHLLPSLDKQLAKGKPVGVGYWPNRFFNVATKDRHTSVVVGREFRDGTCKYLVRNSLGPGCGHYRSPYGKPENCQNGHFWISEKDFVETADVLEFVE